MVDGTGAITNTTISGGTWKRYTNSYTSGSPADPRVGRNLNVQLLLNQSGSLGTVTANFTNTQFQTLMARPKLSFRLAAPPAFQLLWSTNFYWYIPQQTTNLRTGSWEDITDAPIVQGDQLSVRAGLESRQRFFRLRQP
jgi:hypothetical protein